MNWSIGLAVLISLVFSTQIGAAQLHATPWENIQMAESFIASFLRVISRSSAFSSSQLDNMSTIRKTLTEAMTTFNNSNMSSKTKNQTLNMVFASALAEIIATEYGGISIESKTKEIENALSLAFQESMGLNNPQFVGDIKNVILTLAHTKTNGVSTASIVNVEDYKQESLGQLETSTAKATSVSSSAPQRSPGKAQQVPSTVKPPIALNSAGVYRSPIVSVTKPLGEQFQTPIDPYAKLSKQAALSVKNSQGILRFGPQKSSPQVTSVQAQQGTDGYGTGIPMTVATGVGLEPPVQSSGVTELRQHSSIGKIEQEPSSQGKNEYVVQGPSGNGLSTPISYGEPIVPIGLQGSPGIGGKEFNTQEASKAVRQGPSVYEARAQTSPAMGEKEAGSDAINSLRDGYSAYREQEQRTQGASVSVDKRPGVKESGNYGWGPVALISGGGASFKPPAIRVGSQQSQETTGNGTETSSNPGSRAAATVVTDSYAPDTGKGRVQQEVQDFQGSSRARNQYERGIQGQASLGQRQANKGLYGTRYQGIGQFGGQAFRSYKLGADATIAATVGVSGEQAPLGEGSSEVGGQGLDSPRVSEVESRSLTDGLNNYGRGSAAAVETATTDYKIISGVKGQQGVSRNEPELVGRNSYASGSAKAIAGPVKGIGPVESPTASYIFTPRDSSGVSSSSSSLGSSNIHETSTLSNAVNSIVSKVGTAYPGMSDCNVLIQTMLEIIADLVHLLGYCT